MDWGWSLTRSLLNGRLSVFKGDSSVSYLRLSVSLLGLLSLSGSWNWGGKYGGEGKGRADVFISS